MRATWWRPRCTRRRRRWRAGRGCPWPGRTASWFSDQRARRPPGHRAKGPRTGRQVCRSSWRVACSRSAARISSISARRSDSRSPRGPSFAAAASTAWAMYALRASPARLAAASMIVYSSLVSVNSTRRVRGTCCRARRRPCLADAGLAAVADSAHHSVVLPARGFYFVTAFVLPPAVSRVGGLPEAMSWCQFTYGPRPVQT